MSDFGTYFKYGLWILLASIIVSIVMAIVWVVYIVSVAILPIYFLIPLLLGVFAVNIILSGFVIYKLGFRKK